MSEEGTRQTRIRDAVAADATRLAALATQLGYPTTREAMAARLGRLTAQPGHAVLVAEAADGAIAGVVHVYPMYVLVFDRQAEVGAMVVDEAYRGTGIGRALITAAEQVATAAGCTGLHVRANVVRERARGFYASLGFFEYKTSWLFRKPLGAVGEG